MGIGVAAMYLVYTSAGTGIDGGHDRAENLVGGCMG